MTKEEIANRPIYPIPSHYLAHLGPGMSYRQRLIVAALEGAMVGAMEWVWTEKFEEGPVPSQIIAYTAIACADAVIEQLAAEEEGK